MAEFVNLEELEGLAKQCMTPMAFDYYRSGAETETSVADNRAAFERYRVVPRIMRDVSAVDTSTQLLGQRITMPVLVAPMAMHGLAHPDKELATMRAAKAQGVPMCVSTMATCSISEAARAGHPLALFQLYVIKDRAITAAWVREAEAAGYKALVVTVDAPRLGRREADERNRFALPEGLELANLAPLAAAEQAKEQAARAAGGGGSGDGIASAGAASVLQARDAAYGSGLFRLFASYVDDTLTWRDIEWLTTVTKLPVFVKGVLAPEDAELAVRSGAAGVVVSNHGGRQLDYAPAALDMLPAVAAAARAAGRAAGRHVPVLVDGGVRRGSDVLKALALGADAVLVGRPLLYALAVGGQGGVERALQLLRAQFELALALSGCASVRELSPRMLLRSGPVLEPVAAPGEAPGSSVAAAGAALQSHKLGG